MKKYEDTFSETFWDSYEEAMRQSVFSKADALRVALSCDSRYTKDPELLEHSAIKVAMLELAQALRGEFVTEWRSVNKRK